MSKSILRKNKKMLSFLFFLLILLSCFQNIIIYKLDSGTSLKLFHIFSLVFIFIMIIYKRCVLPNKLLLLYFAFATIFTLIHIPKWGFDGLYLNYLFGAYVLVIFYSLGTSITLDEWLRIFTMVATTIIIAVYIKIVINIDAILFYFNNSWSGHPMIETFFGGGVNLEATWIALFNFAFLKSKIKLPYLFLSLLLSALYTSRVGFIINMMYIFFLFFMTIKEKNILSVFIPILSLFFIFFIVYNMGIFDVLLNRFTSIGSDAGSVGRLRMWKYALETTYKYPFGCGLGNSIVALRSVSGLSYVDGNMHNVYMQNFVDLGWIGGCFYIIIIIGFIIKEFKNIFTNPFVAILFVYIMCSMLQFAGGEPIIFCILGVYLSSRDDIRVTESKQQNELY